MTKYEPLRRYLENLPRDEWLASFPEIEGVLGFHLPWSARNYLAWWANEQTPGSSHKVSWLSAGWRAESPNLTAERVIFRRVRKPSNNTLTKTKESKRRLDEGATVPSENAEPEAACTLHFSWVSIGQVTIDSSGKLLFPRSKPSPGLYRFTVELKGRRTVYIGETDNLARRFQHYRTPGPRQETNLRINSLMLEAIRQGERISVAVIVDTARIGVGEKERAADFSSKAERVLFENAALMLNRIPGVVLANK